MEAITFRDAVQLEAWLSEHHDFEPGVWLRLAKKGSDAHTVDIDEVLAAALCWGWIPGLRRALDDDFYLQKITPRRRKSNWSQINIDKVAELIAAGRMRAPGMAAVEAARADGRFPVT